MPGAETLGGCEKLVALLKRQAEANRPYGAIGAATAHVLQPRGLLVGKKATTCASMTGLLADDSECENRMVVVDGNVITSHGVRRRRRRETARPGRGAPTGGRPALPRLTTRVVRKRCGTYCLWGWVVSCEQA